MSADAVTADELVMVQSAAHTEVNGTTTGGAKTATVMTGSAAGEWWPKFPHPETGTLDTDYDDHFQKAFVANDNGDAHDLEDAYWWVRNLLDTVTSSGALKFQSSALTDNGDYKVRSWIKVGSSLVVEDNVLNGTTLVTGAATAAKLYRCRALLSVNDAQTTVNGNVTVTVGSTEKGQVPAGCGWATEEPSFAMVSTLDDSGTTTSRIVDPGGLTYSKPRSESTALPIRNSSSLNTLLAGKGNGIWGRWRYQPGDWAPMARIDLVPRVKGNSN